MKPCRHRFLSVLHLGIALLTGLPTLGTAGSLDACHYWDLVFWMNNVPASAPEHGWNNDAMYVWNCYLDAFRYREDNDSNWDLNGKNEFGGYPTDEQLWHRWLFHWDADDLAMTCQWYGFPWVGCSPFDETDVVFNPAYTWTFDRTEAYGTTNVYYPAVLMHELGHVLGFKTSEDEDYHFSVPTIMFAYYTGEVQDSMPTIHAPDANLYRSHYAEQANPRTVANFMVVSRYADTHWQRSTLA